MKIEDSESELIHSREAKTGSIVSEHGAVTITSFNADTRLAVVLSNFSFTVSTASVRPLTTALECTEAVKNSFL